MPILTPKFRVSYPHVFNPNFNKLSKKNEYSLVALFPPKTDLTVLRKAIFDLMVEKHGANKAKWPTLWKNPLRDQKDRAKEGIMPEGYVPGAFFLNLKSKVRPGLVDKTLQPIIDETEFYAGCYARATINFYYFDQVGNKGVGCGLVNIQKLGDGESLSGRTTPEQDFVAIEDGGVEFHDDPDDINS